MDVISIFVVFPDCDEDFILLGDDISVYNDIPKQFIEIKKVFPARSNYRIFYSSTNIKSFCRKADEICGGKYLDKLESSMRQLIGNNSSNVDTFIQYRTDCYYYRWNINKPEDNVSENIALIKSAAQKYKEETIPSVIVSFKELEWNRDILPIIIDAKHVTGLPVISNIPYFYPYYSLIEWYKELTENRSFSVLDVTKFERTNYVYTPSKRRIYKNLSSGDFWYYDYFHKDNEEHFEVFDSSGHHKGEANVYGVINTTKKDSNKSIAKILFGHQ